MKRLNRKSRKLQLIRRKNLIRQWPECFNGIFYTNFCLTQRDFKCEWCDFWFFWPNSKQFVTVCAQTCAFAAEESVCNKILDLIPEDIKDFSEILANHPLWDEPQEITPSILVYRKSAIQLCVNATLDVDELTEEVLNAFVREFNQSNGYKAYATIKSKNRWEDSRRPKKITVKRSTRIHSSK